MKKGKKLIEAFNNATVGEEVSRETEPRHGITISKCQTKKNGKPEWHILCTTPDGEGRFYYTTDKCYAEVELYVRASVDRLHHELDNEVIYTMAAQKELAGYVKGAIIYDSWGYEQTNIDFYQIIDRKDKSIVIRRISSKRVGGDHMQGHVMPERDRFIRPPKRKMIGKYGIVSRHGAFMLWDGTPVAFTAYA